MKDKTVIHYSIPYDKEQGQGPKPKQVSWVRPQPTPNLTFEEIQADCKMYEMPQHDQVIRCLGVIGIEHRG